jgi:type IV fimbrial biogenesis protein FimT
MSRRQGRQLARQRQAGFSLIELLAVMAIALILLAAGAPNLGQLVRTQQLKAATADLFAAVGLARAQALARGEVVTLLPKGTGGADWRQGWTVFLDRDGDRQPGPGDTILAEHGPLALGIAADFSFTTPAPPFYIAYNGAGRSCRDSNPAAARYGTLSLFHGGGIRRIKINMLGRARSCDPARDASCDGPAAPPE